MQSDFKHGDIVFPASNLNGWWNADCYIDIPPSTPMTVLKLDRTSITLSVLGEQIRVPLRYVRPVPPLKLLAMQAKGA